MGTTNNLFLATKLTLFTEFFFNVFVVEDCTQSDSQSDTDHRNHSNSGIWFVQGSVHLRFPHCAAHFRFQNSSGCCTTMPSNQIRQNLHCLGKEVQERHAKKYERFRRDIQCCHGLMEAGMRRLSKSGIHLVYIPTTKFKGLRTSQEDGCFFPTLNAPYLLHGSADLSDLY